MVADRRTQTWQPALKSIRQFNGTVVAVNPMPGNPRMFKAVDPGSELPYGEIPWWYAGHPGLLTTESGAHEIPLRLAPPESNVSPTWALVQPRRHARG